MAVYLKKSIYITGGRYRSEHPKSSVYRFDLEENSLHLEERMKLPMASHASTIAGHKLFVIGIAIQVLDLEDAFADWVIIKSPVYTKRYNPCVVSLNPR